MKRRVLGAVRSAAVGEMVLGLVRLVWPDTCIACGTNEPTHRGLCEACSRDLLSLTALRACPRCGSTLGPGIKADLDGCWTCPETMFRFARLVRVGPYAPPLEPAIQRMKYRRRGQGTRELAALLAEAVAARCADVALDVAVPVPMHWLRRLRRGSNHSAGLAAGLARRLRIPLGRELVRVRNTPPQVGLPASRRAENVRRAFAVPHPKTIDGAGVLLVDDVMTTGATANEATRALLAAGAERVIVAVLARAEAPVAYAHALRTAAP